MKRLLTIVPVLLLALAGCGGGTAAPATTPESASLTISKATWTNGPWPFTVDAGVLTCHIGPMNSLTFTPNTGTTYWVNGGEPYPLPDVKAIWAPDPASPGGKVDLSKLITLGQALCPK